jgi:hypothetical protein
MRSSMFNARMAIVAVAAAASLGPALAQQQKGTLYAFHTGPIGGCPGLDWHLTVEGNNVEGFVAWDREQHIARLDGTITPASAGQARTFKLDAQEVGGQGRKAIVQGTGGGNYINAMIQGSGTACDGKMLTIPRVVGGMGGGGG